MFEFPRFYLARELKIGIIASIALLIAGTVGFKLAGGPEWSILDAVYMTVITVSTVGFEEVHPLNAPGRVVALMIIISGVGLVFYIAGTTAEAVIEGKIFWRRRMERAIQKLTGHFIVCGFGRMGRAIVRELETQGAPFVVIEKDDEEENHASIPTIIGDATDDECLRRAGIERAKGLVTALGSDAENIYVVLAARSLNPDIMVIARCSENRSRKKLLAAGAQRVVNPYERGGAMLANVMMRPLVIDMFEQIFDRKKNNVLLEQVPVAENSPLCGVRLEESPIRRELDIIVLLVIRESGERIFNPTSNETIHPGDVLVAMGRPSALDRMTSLAAGAESAAAGDV